MRQPGHDVSPMELQGVVSPVISASVSARGQFVSRRVRRVNWASMSAHSSAL